jgi:periplasmic protein TonB
MQAEAILHSNVLDIIFENRNKNYGAYELRYHYQKRLFISIAFMVALVAIWFFCSFFIKPDKHYNATDFIIPPDVNLDKVADKPKIKIKQLKKAVQVATLKNPPPLIMPDNFKDIIPPPVTDELDKSKIGLQNTDGSEDTGLQGPPTEGVENGINNVTPTQTPAADVPAPAVRDFAEVMPQYPGGLEALRRFLGKNLQVPEEQLQPGEKVKVPVRFVVDKEGNIAEISFVTDTNEVFKKEVIRVLKKMPRWEAGLQNGKKVSVYYTIPIVFEVTE